MYSGGLVLLLLKRAAMPLTRDWDMKVVNTHHTTTGGVLLSRLKSQLLDYQAETDSGGTLTLSQ